MNKIHDFKFNGEIIYDIDGNVCGAHGKKVFPNGRYYEGEFVWKYDNIILVKGKTVKQNGTICEGDFTTGNGLTYLSRGKTIFTNGYIHEGEFAIDHNEIHSIFQGKVTTPYGHVLIGKFSCEKNTSILTQGKIILKNEMSPTSNINQETYVSLEGQFKYINDNHVLIKGKIKYGDRMFANDNKIITVRGRTEEGHFTFANNKYTLIEQPAIEIDYVGVDTNQI